MITKLFEIRDANTFIPAVAVLCQVNGFAATAVEAKENYLLRRAGYGQDCVVLLAKLSGGEAHYDVYNWQNRTMQTAHNYIEKNFHQLTSGEVIDVEFILGEKPTKKVSEAIPA